MTLSNGVSIDVLIPAFNEADSIGYVISDLPQNLIRQVIVVNNASTDQTRINAESAGAIVVDEPLKGYGQACLAGINYLKSTGPPDILVFLDADYSDHPNELIQVVKPILNHNVDIVIGSRMLGDRELGSMLPQALIGNRLACFLLRILYGLTFTDLGPFRAIKWSKLMAIQMVDNNFGWTVEMQIKIAQYGLIYSEVPVSYRKRIGVSKITGTISGTIKASYKILYLIFKYSLTKREK